MKDELPRHERERSSTSFTDEIVVEADADESQEEIAEKVERVMCVAGEEYLKTVPVKVETRSRTSGLSNPGYPCSPNQVNRYARRD
jgi:hypothetical protein